MWNQLGSEGILRRSRFQTTLLNSSFTVVLLIRTYAFFNRNVYLLSSLIVCLAGLIAYQLYVATSQMERRW